MIVFWIILSVIFIIFLIFFLFCISTLQIEIKNLVFNSKNQKGKKLENYIIYLKLKLLKKITWFYIKIDKNKIYKIKKSKIFNKKILSKITNLEKDIIDNTNLFEIKEDFKYIKLIDFNIEKINLVLRLSLIDPFITSISIPIISSLIAYILSKNVTEYKNKNYYYVIKPACSVESTINIKLNCIINIKMIHIINVIYMLKKKRSVDYDERTSNRGTYACRYE